MSYDDWKTTDTTEPDPQCDMCGQTVPYETLDRNWHCMACAADNVWEGIDEAEATGN